MNGMQHRSLWGMRPEASKAKALKLDWEIKKLDSTWNLTSKPSMDKATGIDTGSDGNENTKGVHLVFNTDLMT
jgi:hypothetical protein